MAEALERVLDARAELGEGPGWDAERKRLLWVNIPRGEVHAYSPESGKDEVLVSAGGPVGAAVSTKSGGLVLAMQDGFYRWEPGEAKPRRIAAVEADQPDNRFNDGKCDAAGRFWAGTMSTKGKAGAGAFYCLEPDGSVRKVFDGVSISNGIGWSPDNRVMYYIDSPTLEVVAFDFDLAAGALSNRRTAVRIPDGEGVPDGMCVDAEGMIWVAQWGGYKVSRWNPQTGEKLGEISVPEPQSSACAFGGEGLDELYITSARGGVDEGLLSQYPHAGGLYRIKPGVKGLPAFSFGN